MKSFCSKDRTSKESLAWIYPLRSIKFHDKCLLLDILWYIINIGSAWQNLFLSLALRSTISGDPVDSSFSGERDHSRLHSSAHFIFDFVYAFL